MNGEDERLLKMPRLEEEALKIILISELLKVRIVKRMLLKVPLIKRVEIMILEMTLPRIQKDFIM